MNDSDDGSINCFGSAINYCRSYIFSELALFIAQQKSKRDSNTGLPPILENRPRQNHVKHSL